MPVSRFAFFDVDETLINLKSMFSFRDFYLLNKYGPIVGKIIINDEQERIKKMVDDGVERSLINKAFYKIFADHRVSELQIGVKDWYSEVRSSPGFFIQSTLDQLLSHQVNGVLPVFVSGSSQEILAPLADELGVHYVLANKLEIVRNRYTGEIIPPQTIGIGKRDVILDFLKSEDSDPAICYGYGDHISDLPMLEYIGFPAVVAGDDRLIRIGKERGWPILSEAR
ncbi:HAD family hydrolase [Alcaligenes faecalis]|uniref:HAD family hydrolase n=1 Tax=Alcaligenes faecalis TaxID=511 RepID=UPI000A3282DE|nr:HAD-IB family hydrolase [Alcaligenes faecalis]KAA1283503.1 HAD-IB family hydrolase [Alcaligenes faecalis]